METQIDPTDPVQSALASEVPEIADGRIEVKRIAREAGSRVKVAVAASAADLDPVGACVGQGGCRVRRVIARLGGEKIDFVRWSEIPEPFIENALSPFRVQTISLDPICRRANVLLAQGEPELVRADDAVRLRLASTLTGWDLTVISRSG